MNYEKTIWTPGDTVTAVKLNKIEQGVMAAGNSGGGLVVNLSVESRGGHQSSKGKDAYSSFFDGYNIVADKTATEIMAVVEKGGSVEFKAENVDFDFYGDIHGTFTGMLFAVDHVLEEDGNSVNYYYFYIEMRIVDSNFTLELMSEIDGYPENYSDNSANEFL